MNDKYFFYNKLNVLKVYYTERDHFRLVLDNTEYSAAINADEDDIAYEEQVIQERETHLKVLNKPIYIYIKPNFIKPLCEKKYKDNVIKLLTEHGESWEDVVKIVKIEEKIESRKFKADLELKADLECKTEDNIKSFPAGTLSWSKLETDVEEQSRDSLYSSVFNTPGFQRGAEWEEGFEKVIAKKEEYVNNRLLSETGKPLGWTNLEENRWKINQQRVKGFEKYTSNRFLDSNNSCISRDMPESYQLVRYPQELNWLTTDITIDVVSVIEESSNKALTHVTGWELSYVYFVNAVSTQLTALDSIRNQLTVATTALTTAQSKNITDASEIARLEAAVSEKQSELDTAITNSTAEIKPMWKMKITRISVRFMDDGTVFSLNDKCSIGKWSINDGGRAMWQQPTDWAALCQKTVKQQIHIQLREIQINMVMLFDTIKDKHYLQQDSSFFQTINGAVIMADIYGDSAWSGEPINTR
jgi:hypothetical protein